MANVYLQARIQVKYGKLAEFNETMAKVVPAFEQRGWKLLGAYSTIIGDLHEVLDIWELEDANQVGEAMASAHLDAEFQKVAAGLGDLINVEVITAMAKTPYSP